MITSYEVPERIRGPKTLFFWLLTVITQEFRALKPNSESADVEL